MSPLFPCRFLRFNYRYSTTRVVGRQRGDTAAFVEGCKKPEGTAGTPGTTGTNRNPDRQAGRVQSPRGERHRELWLASQKGADRAIRLAEALLALAADCAHRGARPTLERTGRGGGAGGG